MSEIKEKIEIELKPYESMCEQTTEHLKQMITGSEQFAAEEVLAVAKTLGEITDVKKDIVEMCYKKYILKAMEENEDDYGETWDEEGLMRKGYRGRNKYNGRYMHRPYTMTPEMYRENDPEYYRNMDRKEGRMYYTSSSEMPNNSNYGMSNENRRDFREGKSGMSRKSYIESKEKHADNSQESKNMKAKKLDDYMKDLYEDMKEIVSDMSNEEKTVWKQKIDKLNHLIQ